MDTGRSPPYHMKNRPRHITPHIIGLFAMLILAQAALPAYAGPGGNAGEPKTYTVCWGDTLAKLARRFFGDGKRYPEIARANRMSNPHRILVGQVLTIPEFMPIPGKTAAQPEAVTATPAISSDTARSPSLIPPAVEEAKPVFVWRTEPFTFNTGEKLSFDIKWKFITVGFATMMINNIEELEGRKAYHIVTEARSAPFFDTFYRVRDTNESWMDVQALCSLKYASHSDENNQRKNETILLDHEKKEFRIMETGKTGTIPEWVQDVLSALYYLRTKELIVGRDYTFDAHSGDQSWPLRVCVLRQEKVKVPAGEFTCFVVEPSIREGAGLFQAKGRLWVWLTSDERHVPVLMKSKVAVGSIEALLTRMELPQ